MKNFIRWLYAKVRTLWARSIRHQLMLSFGIVSLVMMLGFGYLLLLHQRDFLYTQGNHNAIQLASALAEGSGSWVLADDAVGLQEVTQSFADTSDLKFAMILSPSGEVLASTNPYYIGHFLNDTISRNLLNSSAEPQVLLDQSNLIDVAVPITAGIRHVGWARVELTRAAANANLREISMVGFGFTFLAVIVTFLISRALAQRLTRSLYNLKEVAETVERGQHNVRSTIMREDEVGVLARGFNQMLDTLEDSERKLAHLNKAYAAWTECSEVIVREPDEQALLERICQILAERMQFKLVWVGMTDQDGWVRVVAANDPPSDYLKQLSISVNATLPEGRGLVGVAIREGEPKILNNFLHQPAPWQAAAKSHNFQSVAAMPLMRGGKCAGAITVYSEDINYFSPDLITLLHGLAEDVSYALDNFDLERQRHEAELQLELAARVFENSKEGIMVTDANSNIISVNCGFTEITDYPAEEVIGQNPRILASGRHNQEFFQKMWDSIRATGSWQGELWNRRRGGEVYPQWITITSVKDEAGVAANYIGIFGDISERKLAEERIQQLAHYDVLTGLPNRLLLNDRLEQAMIKAQRNHEPVALLFLDLDRFKQINDTLGHSLGDQLLRIVAQRLQECIREQDTVSRQGGDEFITILPGTDEAGAELVAGKMLQVVAQPYLIEGHALRISSSIGISIYPQHAHDIDTLIKYADVAMYQAKESGRNCCLMFRTDMNTSTYERLTMETSLRAALERKQFQLYYQPQVSLTDGSIIGCEALIRWKHSELGMVSPADFIPLAEETGIIGPISDWVLNEALRQCRKWLEAGLPEITVSVNLSALQFRQHGLFQQVKDALSAHGVPARMLVMEMTESILMQGVEHTLTTLHELIGLGVGLSIDDFGTGYSSLSYLKRFPIQTLKIDQSFVQDITTDPNDAAMVRTIILMAHSLNLQVIAEGVETEAQAEFLREAGCEWAQGYLFERPMPAGAFTKILKQRG